MENEGELLLDGTDSSQTDVDLDITKHKETTVTVQDGGVIILDGTDNSGTDGGQN